LKNQSYLGKKFNVGGGLVAVLARKELGNGHSFPGVINIF
jgi:hypothetical protein